MRPWGVLGGVFGLLAVAFGAFGAHSLRDMVTPERLAVFQTGVHYQAIHALALLFVATWAQSGGRSKSLTVAGVCFTGGVLIFSGSLYALVVLDSPRFGMITPIGGVLFMVGWGALIARALATRD